MEYKKVIAFDMDDVICDNRTDKDRITKYLKRKPIQKNIDIINDLYEEGYKILIYTARGMLSFRGDINEINEIISNKEKLLDVKEKLLTTSFVSETFSEDITKLLDLKRTLTKE